MFSECSVMQGKNIIYYHRAYRKLPSVSKYYFIFSFFLLTALFDFIIFLSYPKITKIITDIAKYVLSLSISGDTIEIITKTFLFKNVYMLDLPGKYPSFLFSLILAEISLVTMLVVPRIKRITKPTTIWIFIIFFINLVSSLFFIFFPDHFPYDMLIFSELYIKTEVSMWLLIPLVMTIALISLPSSNITKFILITFTLSYSILFGCIRYIIFLYLLQKFSYLFMSIMFFIFGPLVDFFYVIGIYSFYVNIVGKQAKKDWEIWKWSF